MNSEYWQPVLLRTLAEAPNAIRQNELALNNFETGCRYSKKCKRITINWLILIQTCLQFTELCTTKIQVFILPGLGFAEAQHVGMRESVIAASKLLVEQYESVDLKKALYYSKMHDSLNEIVYGEEK